MTAKQSTAGKILGFIQRHPGCDWQAIHDRLGLEERSTRLILEDLFRRGYITGEARDIRLIEGTDTASVDHQLGAEFTAGHSPEVIEQLASKIEVIRAKLDRFRKQIDTELAGQSAQNLIGAYTDKVNGWLASPPGGKIHPDVSFFLKDDLDFFSRIVKVKSPGRVPGPIAPDDSDEDVLACAGAFNDIIPLKFSTELIPFEIGLSLSIRSKALQARGKEPQLQTDPSLPGGLRREHMRAITDFPLADPADRVRVRLSEVKVFLYQYCAQILQDHNPSAILLGESLHPPDMWYRDFANDYRRPRHLRCMMEAQLLANASKTFNCPIAQASRSNSTRRRESTVWTKLVFGLLLDNPEDYVSMTMTGNFDDAIWARISKDRAVSEVFTFDTKEAYLREKDEPSARKVFGSGEAGESQYGSYLGMLKELETSMVFVNYRGRGLRLRYFSGGTSEEKKIAWASKLAKLSYRYACEAPKLPSIAYVRGLEAALNHAQVFASNIATSVSMKLNVPESGAK